MLLKVAFQCLSTSTLQKARMLVGIDTWRDSSVVYTFIIVVLVLLAFPVFTIRAFKVKTSGTICQTVAQCHIEAILASVTFYGLYLSLYIDG
jgi:hypothetical protein